MKKNQTTEKEASGKMYFKNNHFLLLKEPPWNDLNWAYQLYKVIQAKHHSCYYYSEPVSTVRDEPIHKIAWKHLTRKRPSTHFILTIKVQL